MKSATVLSIVAAALMLCAAALVQSSADTVAHPQDGLDAPPPSPIAQPPAPRQAPSGVTSVTASSVRVTATVDRPLLMPAERDAWMLVDLMGDADAATSRSPVAMAVVIDTSGSMSGDRIINARAAARELVGSLQPGDRVSIVTYAGGASVLAGNVEIGTDLAEVYAAIEGMRANGSTCMSCGMDAGYRLLGQAPEQHVARMIVVSDGHANQGDTDPDSLALVASRANDDGAATSTVGVGRDYNERLMSAVATSGTGNYYFVAEPSGMAQVVARERAAVERTVARDVLLTVTPAEGVVVRPGDVVGASASGDGVVVRIGQLGAGQHRELLLPLDVGDGDLEQAVRLTLTFIDGAGAEQGLSTDLDMARTDDAAAADAAQHTRVVVARERVAAANRLEDAMHALAEGDEAAASLALDGLDRDLEQTALSTGDAALHGELERVRTLRSAVGSGRVAGGGAEARELYLQNQARAQEANVGVPAADAVYDDVFAR